jgi:hypothetical protein
MAELIRSHKWKFRISIKAYLSTESDPKSINSVCVPVVRALKKLLFHVNNSDIVQEEKADCIDEINSLIENISFMSDLCTGVISPMDWEDLSFSGNFIGLLNSYIFELYELGDRRVETTRGISEKFIWVG